MVWNFQFFNTGHSKLPAVRVNMAALALSIFCLGLLFHIVQRLVLSYSVSCIL